jgi:hypothetical protein
MRRFVSFACAVIVMCAVAVPGLAANRVALVIGNSSYRNVPGLPNPRNDAADIAVSFERLGFSVKRLNDASYDDMRRALLQFGRDARGAEMAAVFFAGHGMEIGGENWLIPIDAELKSDVDIAQEAVGLKGVTQVVSNATRLGLVILDACRNNPFAANMARSSNMRAVGRGLAPVEPNDNVLVAFAARGGTTADDGAGRNSPFTTALLRHMERPVEINFLFRAVRDDVMAATGRGQQPFLYGSLSKEEIYLKEPAAASKAPVQATAATEAERAWFGGVKDTDNTAVLDDFIRRYGDTIYGSLARDHVDQLKRRLTVASAASFGTLNNLGVNTAFPGAARITERLRKAGFQVRPFGPGTPDYVGGPGNPGKWFIELGAKVDAKLAQQIIRITTEEYTGTIFVFVMEDDKDFGYRNRVYIGSLASERIPAHPINNVQELLRSDISVEELHRAIKRQGEGAR